MKRVFSFLLTLALLLALIPAAGAADTAARRFDDWDAIRQQADVAMLTDLGLISGFQDGSFHPLSYITRAEIAKLLAGLLTDSRIVVTGDSFTDTADSWACPYIEYCAARGVLSGRGDGSFRPNDGVTARELAKMLLATLGWRTDAYVGPTWAEAVDADAAVAGIYDGYLGDYAAPLTREGACQLINNALQSSVITGYDEAGQPLYLLDEMLSPKSLLESRFEIVPVTGVVQANAAADLREPDARLEDGRIHISGYAKDFQVSSQVSRDVSLLGHRVTLYARFGTASNRVFGLPGIRPTELSLTLHGADPIDTILGYQGLTFTADTAYYQNFLPCGSSCLNAPPRDAIISIIDHEGDNRIDIVLVSIPDGQSAETPAAS